MADETLTLRMRSRGAGGVERDVDRVSRKVRGLGRDAEDTDRNVNLFSRGLTLLGTRAVMFGVLGASAVAAAGLFSPALLAMTAGVVAFGALLAPVVLIGVGVMQLFSRTAGIAGSAASELTDVLAGLKTAFFTAVAPAAAIVMRSISAALVSMLGPLESMRAPLAYFARFMGQAIMILAQGMAAAQPQVNALIRQLGPELPRLARAAVLVAMALLQIAHYGVPVLHDVVGWVLKFTTYLHPAIDALAKWSTMNMHVSDTAWSGVVHAVIWLAKVAFELYGILLQVISAMEPMTTLIGGALLSGLIGLLHLLTWLNGNFSVGASVVGLLANAMLAYWAATKLATAGSVLYNGALLVGKGIMLGVLAIQWAAWWYNMARAEGIAEAAQLALNVAMDANPVGLLVIALAALVLGLAYVFTHLSQTTSVLQSVWQWVTNAAGAVRDGLVAAFQWLGDKASWLYGKLKPVLDVLAKIVHYSPQAILGRGVRSAVGGVRGLFKADGGPVARGGAYVVGERGPEVFTPTQSGQIIPNHHLAVAGGGHVPDEFAVEATFILPDGEVLAKQTVKAAKKKKATR